MEQSRLNELGAQDNSSSDSLDRDSDTLVTTPLRSIRSYQIDVGDYVSGI